MKEYFSHDYNPTNDPKIQALIGVFGAVGYGVYWRLIEMLHCEKLHQIEQKKYIYIAIAKQLFVDEKQVSEIINSCVNDFELFESDGNVFWCNRVNRNLEIRTNISESRSKAGKASAERRKQKSTSVEQVLTSVEQNSTNVNKEKKRKEKETKINKTINDIMINHNITFEKFKKVEIFLLNYFDKKYVTNKSIESIIILQKTYEPLKIKQAIEWATKDEFWKSNFLSPTKLEKKDKDGVLYIDKFLEKSKEQNNGKSKFTNLSNRIDEPAYLQSLAERLHAK